MNTATTNDILTLQTQLDKIRATGDVPGGTLVAIHEMGPYALVEVQPTEPGSASHFRCYVSGRSLGFQTDSFDYALATCMACRNEVQRRGPSPAAKYFMRMIGQDA